jgi:hypothetical protein
MTLRSLRARARKLEVVTIVVNLDMSLLGVQRSSVTNVVTLVMLEPDVDKSLMVLQRMELLVNFVMLKAMVLSSVLSI